MKNVFLSTCVALFTITSTWITFAWYQPTAEDATLLSTVDTQISQIEQSDEGLDALVQLLNKISAISSSLEEGTRAEYVIWSIYTTINDVLRADGIEFEEYEFENKNDDQWDENMNDDYYEEEEYDNYDDGYEYDDYDDYDDSEEFSFEEEKEVALEDVQIIISNSSNSDLTDLAEKMSNELAQAQTIEDLDAIYESYDASFEQYEDEIDQMFDAEYPDEEWYDDMDYDYNDEDEGDDYKYDDDEDISLEDEKMYINEDLDVLLAGATSQGLQTLVQEVKTQINTAESFEQIDEIFDAHDESFELYEEEIDEIFDAEYGDDEWDEDMDDDFDDEDEGTYNEDENNDE